MKNILFTLLLLPFLALSQTEKGVSPIASPTPPGGGRGEAYAVVVGISDYQDEGIPDLRFADKDAEAFANFLRSPAGGSLDEDHLKLLTNDKATTGQLVAAMDWLVDVCQEGDQAFIYFSGHGDVESKSAFNLGFLLTWDSPSKAYMAGAYPLFYLQAMVSTLSTENKTKILLITDACRSGKLAGNDIAGNQLTNANLAKQFANEIKILSCQPDEYSIEGEQWGGGRGAFSYHLIDGLIGLADNNGDQAVSLMEISRYLEDHVTTEVAPQNQVPMTVGNRTEKLTDVMPDLLAQLQQGKKGQLDLFASTDSRGMEDDILASVDSITREKYLLFKKSLQEKVFLEPAGACSDAFYTQLVGEPKLERLHASMRRNYAAALQDEAQQVLNKILNNDVQEISLSKISQTEKYRLYPGYLQRAAELLGEDHYMYPVLQARKLYFEGYLLHIENEFPDRELGERALAKYRAALALQPDFPHPYHSMSAVYFWQLLEPDSAEYYTEQAVGLAPSWFVPYSALATMYARTQNSVYIDKIRHYLEQADRVDSTSSRTNLWHMLQWGKYYLRTSQNELAEKQFKKVIALDDNFAKGHRGLGGAYFHNRRFKEATEEIIKSIALDSTDWKPFVSLGLIYQEEGRYAEAEVQYKKALQLDMANLEIFSTLAGIYNLTDRYVEADSLFDKVFQLDSTTIFNYYIAMISYVNSGRYHKAEAILLKGLQLDSNSFFLNHGLGYLYIVTRRYDEAEQLFLPFYHQDTMNAQAIAFMGGLYLETNRHEAAERQWLKLLNIDSLDVAKLNSHASLGRVYTKMGRYEEAELLFQKDMALHPKNTKNVFVNYAELYAHQGQLDKAFDYLERALEKGYKYKYNNHIDLKDDPGLEPMRAQVERWNILMKKYFPDQFKD